MTDNSETEISRIAYSLWLGDGQPHGRDRDHWDAAKEIWAYQSSRKSVDESAGAPPAEPILAVENQGIPPGLTDQGEKTVAPRRRKG